ncbi:metallophosphoesterase family protein [Bacillus sp. V3]|nr:metallophosphoesterase family protein [Bacillus sp. V3]
MKITVLSDTHLPKGRRKLPDNLIKDIQESEFIIHAGDFQSAESYKEIARFGELVGVYGNVDDREIRNILPKRRVCLINGVKIGIVHGDGKGKTTEMRARESFDNEEVDMIIFGHSHIPYLRYHDGVLLFNPGSPTDKRKMPMFSHGLMEIEHGGSWSIQHKFYS